MNWSSPETRSVIYWIVGILLFFSITGRVLRRVLKSEKGQATVQNLITRVRSWWVMAAVVIGSLMGGRTTTPCSSLFSWRCPINIFWSTPDGTGCS